MDDYIEKKYCEMLNKLNNKTYEEIKTMKLGELQECFDITVLEVRRLAKEAERLHLKVSIAHAFALQLKFLIEKALEKNTDKKVH